MGPGLPGRRVPLWREITEQWMRSLAQTFSIEETRTLGPSLILPLLALLMRWCGCSVKKFAINKLGDSLASGGTNFASDDDPDLSWEAPAFSLKLMEGLLAESPRHRGLLFATSSGFTQYAYVFVTAARGTNRRRQLWERRDALRHAPASLCCARTTACAPASLSSICKHACGACACDRPSAGRARTTKGHPPLPNCRLRFVPRAAVRIRTRTV